MTGRLRQLLARLENVPEPVGSDDRRLLSLGKQLGKALVAITEIEGDVPWQLEKLAKSAKPWKMIDALARAFGEDHDLVKILRAIHAVATAMVEGIREPTDEELGLTTSHQSAAQDTRGRLRQLQGRLDDVPEPTDLIERLRVTMGRTMGLVAMKIPDVQGNPAGKRELLAKNWSTIGNLARGLGESHEVVQILREMHSIVADMVEGRE